MKKSLFLCLSMLLLLSCATTNNAIKKEQERQLEIAQKEKEIGKAVFAKLAGKYGVTKDKATTEYLNKFGKSLAMFCERQEFEYFFGILDTDQVNAYALPGGYILISKGALKSIESPGTLAGVIAHELGHVNLRHITDNVKIETKMNFFEILARFIAGPRQIVSTVANQVSEKIEEKLFIEGFASDTEFEADAYALEFMKSLNIDPTDYINYLEKLETNVDKKALAELDKTHPSAKERIEKLKANNIDGLRALPTTDKFTKFSNAIRALKSLPEESTNEV